MDLARLQKVTLYLFFFSINFEVWDPLNTGGSFSISKLTGFLYFITVLPQIKQFFYTNGIKSVLKPLWCFFFLLTIISFIHINTVTSSFFDFSIFQNIVLLWILINHERKTPGVLYNGLLSFAFGSVFLSVLYHFGVGVTYEAGRVSLFGDNENAVGMRMSISSVILLIYIIQNPLRLKGIRYIFIFTLPIMLKLMAESGSRMAFIAFIVMFSMGVLLLKAKRIWYKILILFAGSFLFVFILQYILSSDVLMMRLVQTAEKGDLAGRDLIWQKVFPLIKNNFIFGVGKTGYDAFAKSVFFELRSPHNVIIEVLCYTGIIGLLLYLYFIIGIFKLGWKVYKLHGIILPVILFVPIAGFLLSGQILTNKIIWGIMAYIIAVGSTSLYTQNFKISK